SRALACPARQRMVLPGAPRRARVFPEPDRRPDPRAEPPTDQRCDGAEERRAVPAGRRGTEGRVTLSVGSLFSGVGGLDLGLERAGMRVAWQSEIDPAACKVLAHHYPEVRNLGDVTRIGVASGHDAATG